MHKVLDGIRDREKSIEPSRRTSRRNQQVAVSCLQNSVLANRISYVDPIPKIQIVKVA